MEEEIRYEEALERRWVQGARLLVVVDVVWQKKRVRGRVMISVVLMKDGVGNAVEVVVSKSPRVVSW